LQSDVDETEKFASPEFSKILGQVLAFDPDEGDAGKIEFFFKEGDSLVKETGKFRIETDTGKIHQIKPLDREEMNKHNVSVKITYKLYICRNNRLNLFNQRNLRKCICQIYPFNHL